VFGRDAGYTALYTAHVTAVRYCIPEYKVDLKHPIELTTQDNRNNPSDYSLVIPSEGAEWQGYTVKEYGEADPFGHRKKRSVAEDLSDEIKRVGSEETVVSDLTYDLRSGSPDFVDRMIGFHVRRYGHGCPGRRQIRTDDRDQRRALCHGAAS
jgi:ATP-dependent phosphofructokinase / diphosphate-dependent phosphofructokinase